MESHLLQMRGLKRRGPRVKIILHMKSHLLQMRGLKRRCHRTKGCSRRRIFYRCVD